MPDISMCANVHCPSKKECYRFTAKPSEFTQSYGAFEPKKGESKCEYYWDNKKRKFKMKQIKKELQDNGIFISAVKRREMIQEFNNFEMPLGTRVKEIIKSPKKFIDFVKSRICPSCNKVWIGSGSYCSEECLNKDLPF